jgi:hypothetical protein
MTEAEWLACTDSIPMLKSLNCKDGDRKPILFGIACCRRFWHLLTNERSRRVVGLTEQRADGDFVEREEWMTIVGGAHWVAYGPNQWAYTRENVAKWQQTEGAGTPAAIAAALLGSPEGVAGALQVAAWENSGTTSASLRDANRIICGLARDIFGNPFRPLPSRPEVIAPLAEQIYAGDWDLMPLLGQWLQEHGYRTEGEHCLDPHVQHVKGCYVVDWVTGPE